MGVPAMMTFLATLLFLCNAGPAIGFCEAFVKTQFHNRPSFGTQPTSFAKNTIYMSGSGNSEHTVARDFYSVLGISRHVDTDEIKRAYRDLARELHPDANLFVDTTEQFQQIYRAYEVLTDPTLKLKYDMYGDAGLGMKTMPSPFVHKPFGSGYVVDLTDQARQHRESVEQASVIACDKKEVRQR